MNKTKIARILFIIVGCIFPIFIGGLHTFVHFAELVAPQIQTFLQGTEFLILGEKQALWNTWGVVSFMMGASFIVIGLLNISLLRRIPKTSPLPILSIIAMILYQLGVIYVGYEFEQAFQFYGGIFGIVLILICFFLSLNSNN